MDIRHIDVRDWLLDYNREISIDIEDKPASIEERMNEIKNLFSIEKFNDRNEIIGAMKNYIKKRQKKIRGMEFTNSFLYIIYDEFIRILKIESEYVCRRKKLKDIEINIRIKKILCINEDIFLVTKKNIIAVNGVRILKIYKIPFEECEIVSRNNFLSIIRKNKILFLKDKRKCEEDI